jgi:hypothetical protein
MDSIVASHMLETFAPQSTAAPREQKPKRPSNAAMLIGVVLGVWAASLAWRCGTDTHAPTHFKIATSVLAFLFGGLYLIFYFVFMFGRCNRRAW